MNQIDHLKKQNRALWTNLHLAKIELERLYNNFGSRWPADYAENAAVTIKELEKVLMNTQSR